MWAHLKIADRIILLADEIQSAQTITADLFSHVVDDACVRLLALAHTQKAIRLNRLIKDGAWIEAALALIELELPQWQLRRLVHDGDEWLCSVSRQPNLPAEFDDTADARHKILPLALLSAFLEARRQVSMASRLNSPRVPNVRPAMASIACCDNFS
jgi:hypothetical protein